MGIYSGAVSLCRYRLVGVKATSLAKLSQKLRTYQAKAIKLEAYDDEERIGWVLPAADPSEDEGDEREGEHWDMSDCQFEDGFLLRLRCERKKVPAELLQLLVQQRLQAALRGRDKPLSRKAQKELKDEVKGQLLARSLPAVSYVDAHWHEGGQIILFSTGKKNRENFETLFVKTFAKPLGGRLMRVDPPLLALSAKEWEHQAGSPTLERIARLVPAVFGASGLA